MYVVLEKLETEDWKHFVMIIYEILNVSFLYNETVAGNLVILLVYLQHLAELCKYYSSINLYLSDRNSCFE